MGKEKMTDIDYIKEYIKEVGYKPKTKIDNLISKLLLMYEGHLIDEDIRQYAIKDKRSYPSNLMINIADLDVYVYDNGGLSEFDYYA